MARSKSHALRRFAQESLRRRALVIEAILYLGAARLGLAAMPFPRLASHFGTAVTPDERHRDGAAAATFPHAALEAGMARDVGWAVTRAARYVPFRAVCLPQAMAARAMLARRGIASTLHFGAAPGDDSVLAHAWLDAGGIEVTGYPVPDQFAEVACFVWNRPSRQPSSTTL